MPVRTGKLSYTETPQGMAATLSYVLEPHPPFITDTFTWTVEPWQKDAVRSAIGATVTVTTIGTPETVSAITVR